MSDYTKYRGKCREFSEKLIAKDNSLILVRGYYYCPIWGKQEHWWTKKKSGEIVDPTKMQFPSNGTGIYEEFDGNVNCEQCGFQIKEENAIMNGPYPCCSQRCALDLVGL